MVIVGFIVINQFVVWFLFKRNPYYQYFCGYSNYMPGMPCNATELVHFRKRIGVKGFNLIFKMSVVSLLAMVLRRVKAFLALARFLTWRK
jgi:IS5 family transposase